MTRIALINAAKICILFFILRSRQPHLENCPENRDLGLGIGDWEVAVCVRSSAVCVPIFIPDCVPQGQGHCLENCQGRIAIGGPSSAVY